MREPTSQKKRHPKAPFWLESDSESLFDEGFLALGLYRRQKYDDEQHSGGGQQTG
jgi:hypothetical protein